MMLMQNLENQIKKYHKIGLTRKRYIISHQEKLENKIWVNGKSIINFSSNDYLGLNKNQNIIESFTEGVKKYGFGSGASALISGYSEAHAQTEVKFAKWLNVDKAILFNSGYQANIGVISALVNRSDIVISDKHCHSSLLEGIQLSRAKHYRYDHNDLQHLKLLSKNNPPDLIVTESIFSMEGDIAQIKEIKEIAQGQGSGLIIDDAHGIGFLGNDGRGISDEFNLTQNQYTCLVLPLGKAFNGIGAIVAGRSKIIDAILQFAKSYRYSTALPPAICLALQAVLSIIMDEKWRRELLKRKIHFFINYASEIGLELISKDITPIKCITILNNNKTMGLQAYLLEQGFYVSAIRPPTVPQNSSRLRISLNCHHTESQIMKLLDSIKKGLKNAIYK
jgi:8-amino-7-oxononanoate synthase